MSEIRINIIDESQTFSGTMHGSFGDVLMASLTAEPETVEELKTAVERFLPGESNWSVFRFFKNSGDFEAWDAGLLVIDLAAKVVWAESSYSYYSREGTVRIKTDEDEDFNLPYLLSDDWKCVGSEGEFNFAREKGWERRVRNPAFDVREILFGEQLFEFILEAYEKHKNSEDEDLFTEIQAEWLMTAREDLSGRTPREVLLKKTDFIESDLHSRSLQWSFTNVQPPPIPQDSNAYKFAGFGRHEIVMYYDFVRHLLGEYFENDLTDVEDLKQTADVWLNSRQNEFSGRTPAEIVETERRRINLTAHECILDEDCEVCQMLALEFIDSPMFVHYDGSQIEYDRFEFSFDKTREEWEEKQHEME